jgi:hypothetical protein
VDEGIVVMGQGAASGPPDIVRVRLAATATRGRVAEALSATEAAVTRIRAALAGAGIEGPDAATAGVSLVPMEVWVDGEGSRITGYRGEHALAMVVREVDRTGAVLAAALEAGAEEARLEGVGFEVADESGLRARARELAWADARARAEQLAGLAGRPLGSVLAVEEVTGPGTVPVVRAMKLAAAEMDVQPGSVGVEVSLVVRWALLA